MNQPRLFIRLAPVLLALLVVAARYFSAEKVTDETGRTVRVALSPEQESQLGLQSYQQVLSDAQPVTSGPNYDLVRRVAERIERGTGAAGAHFQWAVSLIPQQEANAYCLPGGKVVVYTGILPIAQTEAGLATVLGHEVAHAICRHGSERLFKEQSTQTVMNGLQGSISDMDYANQQWIMSALGAGARYGVTLPWGREQESEADHLGLLYMARAGYDPQEAIAFWERMQQSGGRAAPQWLSDHPSNGNRIAALQALLPQAEAEYQKARP